MLLRYYILKKQSSEIVISYISDGLTATEILTK